MYRGWWAWGGGGGAPMNIVARAGESPTLEVEPFGPCAVAQRPSVWDRQVVP